MSLATYPQPPVDMTVPETTEAVITVVLGCIVAAVFVGTLVYWRRTGSPLALILTLGGVLCSFNEPLVDTIGHVWFPQDSIMTWEFFGRGVPLWVVFSYTLFFGTAAFIQVTVMRSNISRKTVWIGMVVFWVANMCLEIPILLMDVYQYYGDQPFEIGGFPIAWATINDVGDFMAAVLVLYALPYLRGGRQWLLIVVPFFTYAASLALSMPYFLALNSEADLWVKYVAAVVAIGTVLAAIDVLIRIGKAAAAREARAAEPELVRA